MISVAPMAVAVVMLDDNPDDVDIMAIAASELSGLEFSGTDDPSIAFDALLHAADIGAPTVLLVDWHLPGEASAQLIASVRAQPSMARTYVVVNSGSNDPTDRAAALAAGASTYSVKPAGFDATVEMLSGIVGLITGGVSG